VEPTKYECPKCGVDMTEQVNKQCSVSLFLPALYVASQPTRKGARAESVSLQCPNGDWAEYTCPEAAGLDQ
jgi:hypothetical protein